MILNEKVQQLTGIRANSSLILGADLGLKDSRLCGTAGKAQ